jgi:hypothetical protein
MQEEMLSCDATRQEAKWIISAVTLKSICHILSKENDCSREHIARMTEDFNEERKRYREQVAKAEADNGSSELEMFELHERLLRQEAEIIELKTTTSSSSSAPPAPPAGAGGGSATAIKKNSSSSASSSPPSSSNKSSSSSSHCSNCELYQNKNKEWKSDLDKIKNNLKSVEEEKAGLSRKLELQERKLTSNRLRIQHFKEKCEKHEQSEEHLELERTKLKQEIDELLRIKITCKEVIDKERKDHKEEMIKTLYTS